MSKIKGKKIKRQAPNLNTRPGKKNTLILGMILILIGLASILLK